MEGADWVDGAAPSDGGIGEHGGEGGGEECSHVGGHGGGCRGDRWR